MRWERVCVSEIPRRKKLCFWKRGFLFGLLKMCKNSAGPRSLCVAGSARRFVLHKEKMARPIVFRPFSPGTKISQVLNTCAQLRLLVLRKM